MLTSAPILISENNLSYAWAKAFLIVMQCNKSSLCPMVLSVGGFNKNTPVEDVRIRQALDRTLLQYDRYTSAISASVIFPNKHWELKGRPPSSKFFAWYLEEFLPRLKARGKLNRNGTYFERMIAFRGTRQIEGQTEICTKNQLEQIINQWRRDQGHARRPRQSALQAACFDPPKDHTGQPMRGFPCLQQVGFTYDSGTGLSINAFYPTQYIFDRAYGNYLGLCHLGNFMAHELRMNLVRFNAYISYPELGTCSKFSLMRLKNLVQEILEHGTIQNP